MNQSLLLESSQNIRMFDLGKFSDMIHHIKKVKEIILYIIWIDAEKAFDKSLASIMIKLPKLWLEGKIDHIRCHQPNTFACYEFRIILLNLGIKQRYLLLSLLFHLGELTLCNNVRKKWQYKNWEGRDPSVLCRL